MSEKRNSILTIAVLVSVILIFTVVDLFQEDRIFSETENRILTARPELTKEAVLNGSFAEAYENYVTDQFVSRDKWITVKSRLDLLLGKSKINGVYFGEDGYLFEEHKPGDFTEEQMEKKLALLEELVQRWRVRVMLVPTADNVITDKLPENAPYYDETELLARVKEMVGTYNYVDVAGALAEHSDEEIYYRTDHHWTSLGAYYGYREWVDTAGVIPLMRDPDARETVTDEFLGTPHSRVNLSMPAEKIQYYPQTAVNPVEVTYDFGRTETSLYSPKFLDTKNKYGYFLDDNHAFVEIHTSRCNGRKLFVIKDSYANSVIPMLTPHYEDIYVVDPRYFNGRLFDFMEQFGDRNDLEVLVLYNCAQFMEDFRYNR